jgi:CDP-diglyceride synthetase
MQIFALIGLSLIIIAWVLQLLATMKGSKNIQPSFILFYLIGVVFLVIDGFMAGLNDNAFLNLISVLVSLAVFVRLVTTEEHKTTVSTKPKAKRKRK